MSVGREKIRFPAIRLVVAFLLLHNATVRRTFLPLLTTAAVLACSTLTLKAQTTSSESRFSYREPSGTFRTVHVIHRYWSTAIVHPFAQIDSRIDPKLRRAATFAEERSSAQSKARCWHYVKEALVGSGAIASYPTSSYACQAGDELVRNYGFHRLSIRDPYQAPLGAVLVYGQGSNGAGHVELRTKTGFVSDYHSKNRCKYPLIAAYVKYSS